MKSLSRDNERNADAFAALASGTHNNPFAILGPHASTAGRVIRTFQPQAASVDLIDASGALLASMVRVHKDGIFVALMPARKRRYKFRLVSADGEQSEIEDCFRFPQTLDDTDLYLLGEGSDKKIYDKLGAHPREVLGVAGTRFAVWAPERISG